MAARTINELLLEFRQISERASGLFGGFAAEVIARRPKPNSWSAAECLAHLNLSVDAYFPVWEKELAEAPRGAEPYRLDFWGKALMWTLEPPPKFRFPAPAGFHPVDIEPAELALPRFLERRRRIAGVLESARRLALDQIKIRSPFDARVRYSVRSSFCVTAAHDRRHLWQAERALKEG